MSEEILCPKCGSNQLSANKKGFSGKKAVAGAILTGGIGLLAGTIGSGKIRITCLACGHVFKPGEDLKSVQKKKQQQAEAMKKPGFWIFLVVFLIIFIWIVKSCNDTTSTNNEPTLLKDSIDKISQDSINKANALEQKKWDKSKAGKIQKGHPDWSKEDCTNIANNKIWVGMSLDMLKYERGNPNTANPSNYGDATQWQWCWDNYTPSCFYGGDDKIITSYN